jgi:hypothetical protein
MMANMMNIKKIVFATPAAMAKTPVNPMMAAIIAIARKINAHANIIVLLHLNWLKVCWQLGTKINESVMARPKYQ